MAKITMIARKPHSYGMRVIDVDEEFDVDNDQQAQTLISLGRATLKEAKGKSSKTEPTTTKSAEDEEYGKYKTRQMKAKGDK